jgi:hypothetical protein
MQPHTNTTDVQEPPKNVPNQAHLPITAIATMPTAINTMANNGFHMGASLSGPSVKSWLTSLNAVYSYITSVSSQLDDWGDSFCHRYQRREPCPVCTYQYTSRE